MNNHIIGIDFGTSKISVAIWDQVQQMPKLIKLGKFAGIVGPDVAPAFIGFNELGTVIGYEAMAQLTTHPGNTIFDIKRLFWKQLYGPDSELEYNFQRWPIQSAIHEHIHPETGALGLAAHIVFQRIYQKILTPDILLACIIYGFKRVAETQLGHPITNAILSVPVSYNQYQRGLLRAATIAAGLQPVQIITDVEAVLRTLELCTFKSLIPSIRDDNVLIVDVGGGHFDISLVRFCHESIDIRFSMSLSGVGGVDFINRVSDHLLGKIEISKKWKISNSPIAMAKFRVESERIMIELSRKNKTPVVIADGLAGFLLESELSRSTFEDICKPLFVKIQNFIKDVVDRSSPAIIKQVIFAGKCTLMPKIQQLLKDECGQETSFNMWLDPDKAVSFGAAIWPYSFPRYVQEPQDGIFHQLRKVHGLLPFSLGIEIAGGVFAPVILGNETIKTPFPIQKTMSFKSNLNIQDGIIINVYEGNAPLVDNNWLLKPIIFLRPEKKNSNNVSVPKSEQTSEDDNNVIVTFAMGQNQQLDVTLRSLSLLVTATTTVLPITSSSQEVLFPATAVVELMMDEKDMQSITARNTLHEFIQRYIGTPVRDKTTDDARKLFAELELAATWLEQHQDLLLNVEAYEEKLKHLRGLCKG